MPPLFKLVILDSLLGSVVEVFVIYSSEEFELRGFLENDIGIYADFTRAHAAVNLIFESALRSVDHAIEEVACA